MPELKVELSEELKHRMDELPNVEWSDVVGGYLKEEVYRLIRLKSIVSKSKFTEEDALELGRKVNADLSKRYKELLKGR